MRKHFHELKKEGDQGRLKAIGLQSKFAPEETMMERGLQVHHAVEGSFQETPGDPSAQVH